MRSQDVKRRLHHGLPSRIVYALYPRMQAENAYRFGPRRHYFAYLSDKVATGIPCIVVACDEEEFVVQVLSVPGKAGSFVEATVRLGDDLYPFLREKVGMLNLAGPEEAIETLGENFGKGHYNIYISEEQHAGICQPKAKE